MWFKAQMQIHKLHEFRWLLWWGVTFNPWLQPGWRLQTLSKKGTLTPKQGSVCRSDATQSRCFSGQTLCSLALTCLGAGVMYSVSAVPCATMLCWHNTTCVCVCVSASYPLHVWSECLPSPWSDCTQTGLTILGLSRGLPAPNLSAL